MLRKTVPDTKPTVNQSIYCIHYTRVKIGGGLWGLDPHWKTDNPHYKRQGKKARGLGFDPPPHLGLIPANAFIMISLVLHRLYCSVS